MSFPEDVQDLCQALLAGLKAMPGDKLYGIFVYGAAGTAARHSLRSRDGGLTTIVEVATRSRWLLNTTEQNRSTSIPENIG